MDERIAKFNRYLVTYGPEDEQTGIKGIRSDAPEEAIEAFIEWYRDEHRYENGRKFNKTSKKIRNLVIDVDDADQGSNLKCCSERPTYRLSLCESH